ncbi:Uncharacterised protein [Paucimonas lemoignei]|jgi:hypothetical protein|nr:Uncharacterised protein [Paucimonas lemoignei]
MIELNLYIIYFVISTLLFLPSIWAKRASSRARLTIISYRVFFTYNVTLMIINIGISRTGNIPLTNIQDAPFVDIFSLIMALAYGGMMASLSKPDQYPENTHLFYRKLDGIRKTLTINVDQTLYFLRISIFVLCGAAFYTVVFNYVLSELITLEPQYWRLIGYITYPICVAIGIWCVRTHHKRNGRTL